jgi:hypothetical protein
MTRPVPGYIPAPQAYADAKQAYVKIEYPALGKCVKFMGFITEYSDTITANWNKEELLQRNDIIATYKNTTRTINLGWSVPNADLDEAKHNLESSGILMRMLYGVYGPVAGKTNSESQQQTSQQPSTTCQNHETPTVLQQPPLLKVSFSSLVRESAGEGLYVVVSNFSFSPDLDAGFFDPGTDLYPKSWELSLEGDVIHSEKLGWNKDGSWRGSQTFPFLPEPATTTGGPPATPTGTDAAQIDAQTAQDAVTTPTDDASGQPITEAEREANDKKAEGNAEVSDLQQVAAELEQSQSEGDITGGGAAAAVTGAASATPAAAAKAAGAKTAKTKNIVC